MKRVIIFYILLIGMTASLSAQLKVGLLYYKPKYDLTDDVLHELRKLDNSK